MSAGFIVMSFIVTGVLVAVETVLHRKRLAAVTGTRERYLWSSWFRLTAWALVAALTIFTIGDMAGGFIIGAICNAVLAATKTWINLRVLARDDDWFTGRGRKIKQAFRRAITARRPAANAA